MPSPKTALDSSWTNFPLSAFGLAFATQSTLADFNSDADLDSYSQYLASHPSITLRGGSVLRVVDMAPGAVSPTHRTVSLDYGVVLEGEVRRRLPRGDIFVQRGTMHLWRNPSHTQPVRMLLIHLDSKEIAIEGKGVLENMNA